MSIPPASSATRPGLSTDDLGFLFRDEHRAMAAKIRQTVAKVTEFEEAGSSRPIAKEAGELERGIMLELGNAGFLKHFAPQSGKVDLRAICLVREGIAWASGGADSLFAVQGLGTYPIHAFATAEQKARFVPHAVAGRAIAAFGLTEPEAGTDVASMQTVAVKDGDRWKLTGTKTFISNAPVADQMVVFANADPPARRKGITAFIVQRKAPGVAVHGPIAMIADHSIGTVHLDGAIVPDADKLGDVGRGFEIAMSTLDTFRVSVGAAACGMARRALDEALHRAVTRKQFGKEIAEFQQIQAYLADSIAELDAARLLVYRAALLKDEGAASITEEAAVAKMYATEAAQRIIDRCLQIHGGLGVVRGIAVERLYREIRALRIYEGTTEIQRVVIATRRLEKERQARAKGEGV
ncbi:MAG: acyl-CoA dehydrogenase family protein [Polyangiaceae bacterium]